MYNSFILALNNDRDKRHLIAETVPIKSLSIEDDSRPEVSNLFWPRGYMKHSVTSYWPEGLTGSKKVSWLGWQVFDHHILAFHPILTIFA